MIKVRGALAALDVVACDAEATAAASLRPRFRAVYVLCPGGVATGGPDSCHRLVSALNEAGATAFISYICDGGQSHVTPPYDALYDTPVADRPEDADDVLVVAPEVFTQHLRRFRRAHKAVWWLSLDHFVGYVGAGEADRRRRFRRHAWRSFLRLPTGRLKWSEMRHVEHYSKTGHALDYLQRHGVSGSLLRSPLNDIFLRPQPVRRRRNLVAYNPAKGMELNRQVLAALAPTPAIVLQGLSQAQLVRVLGEVKAYIDFGYFPGAERLPREALICGACIVVGRQGAAAHPADFPIPDAYKIDVTQPDFARRARDAVHRIFRDFEACSGDFDPFRAQLRAGPAEFAGDVRQRFFSPPDLG